MRTEPTLHLRCIQPMAEQKVTFDNGRGQTLTGQLVVPEQTAPQGWAIFAHCFTCTKNINAVRRISRALAEEGFGSLSFDFTGLGESEGDFGATGLSADVADLVAAADWLLGQGRTPTLLIGHSLGGAAASAAANRIGSIRAVATIGAPADAEHVTRLFEDQVQTIEQQGSARVSIGGRSFSLTREFLDDIRSVSVQEHARQLDKPLMIFHSPIDKVVGIDNAARLYDAARHPKSFVSLDGADHLLSERRDARFVAQMTAIWASRYLATAADSDTENSDVPINDDQVTVTLGQQHYPAQIQTASHRLIADEPTQAGGGDTGPDPYRLLLASLGACTAITLRMYADRKQWSLEQVAVGLTHQRVHAQDCEQCEQQTGYTDQVDRTLQLYGNLDQQQRQRLQEIADKCPVHRTLSSGVMVNTELAEMTDA